MNEELAAIPPARRRQLGSALAPLGVVLLVAGIVAVSREGIGWTLAGLLVAALALGLLGVAWGLRRSAALSEAAAAEQAAERQLDEVLAAAARSQGASCGGAGAGPDGVQESADSPCGAADLCGSANAPGGCGARCLTGTPSVDRV